VRPWLTRVFVDEETQRLALGMFALYPARLRERGFNAPHFDGRCRTLFQALASHVERCPHIVERDGLDFEGDEILLEDLRRDGLIAFTFELVEEWNASGVILEDLRARLDEQWIRRRLNVLGELLIDVARDPARSRADLVAIVLDLAGMAA
jgi:hypothetical protein